jgi:hypothetical protein
LEGIACKHAPLRPTDNEVLAIAQHEQIPQIAAAELGSYLLHMPEGEMRIKVIIRDDMADAGKRGDRARELGLRMVLRNFVVHIRTARSVTAPPLSSFGKASTSSTSAASATIRRSTALIAGGFTRIVS